MGGRSFLRAVRLPRLMLGTGMVGAVVAVSFSLGRSRATREALATRTAPEPPRTSWRTGSSPTSTRPSEAVRTCASCTSMPEHSSIARAVRTSSLTARAISVSRGLAPALIGTVSRNSSQSCRKAVLPPG